MSVLVHITDEKRSVSILRSGIRLPRKWKAIYFMPVTQSYFISHQWIRELRRGGARVMAGIYFRLPNTERIWAGKYNSEHRLMTLGEAIGELRALTDPLGYEMFTDRSIPASAIQKVKAVSPKIGWRYMPDAHKKKALCGCPMCMPRGMIKSRKLRERLEPSTPRLSLDQVKAKLLQPLEPDDVMFLLCEIRNKYRRVDPLFLEPLMKSEVVSIREEVARTLPYFRHARAVRWLETLSSDDDPNVASLAKEGLAKVRKGQSVKRKRSASTSKP